MNSVDKGALMYDDQRRQILLVFGLRLVLDYPNTLLGGICERHGRMIRNTRCLGIRRGGEACRIEIS
jgi:hypothetical protein